MPLQQLAESMLCLEGGPLSAASHAACFLLLTAHSLTAQQCLRRYALNIAFNLSNKTVFNYFPFPWTVSAIHVCVGALYCGATYLLGFKEASFGRVSNQPRFSHIRSCASVIATALCIFHWMQRLFTILCCARAVRTATQVQHVSC